MLTPWPVQADLPAKNYKINLLMDVITTYRALRTKVTDKSHEKVDVFLHAGTDMVEYIQENELLVKKLVGIDEIVYGREGSDSLEGYTTDVVVNMTLGVKGIHTISRAEQISTLESELEKENQFLQTIRKTLSNSSFVANAPVAVIETKKAKMAEVKARIEAIDMELRRLKM